MQLVTQLGGTTACGNYSTFAVPATLPCPCGRHPLCRDSAHSLAAKVHAVYMSIVYCRYTTPHIAVKCNACRRDDGRAAKFADNACSQLATAGSCISTVLHTLSLIFKALCQHDAAEFVSYVPQACTASGAASHLPLVHGWRCHSLLHRHATSVALSLNGCCRVRAARMLR